MSRAAFTAVLLLCIAAGCYTTSLKNQNEPVHSAFNKTEKPVVIRVPGSFGGDILNVEELARESDVIVTGRVKEILPARWDTPDGKQPAELPGHKIYTDVVVDVEKYLKNPQPEKLITVRTEGGKAGNVEMITGDATFTKGERVVLFLWKSPSGVYVVKGGACGKFSILNNTAYREGGCGEIEISLEKLEYKIENSGK